ncbi:MAG: hypothetical protein WC365_06595 [Candidatus Babeliales bacterium]|jgi:hypothetical protein
MKIVAIFNIYNEVPFIREAVESASWCDRIIVVDGAFKGFPTTDGKACSNDDTLEILYELKRQYSWSDSKMLIITTDKPWDINKKMQRYLQLIDYGNYFLRMNGDEIIESSSFNIRQCLEEYVEETGGLPLYQFYEYRPHSDGSKYDWIPKMIKKTPALNLSQRHLVLTNSFVPAYKLAGGRNRVVPNEANIPKNVVRIRHLTEQRSEQRQQQNSQWLKVFHTLGIE